MADDDVNLIMKDLQDHLQKANVRLNNLSSIAQKGDEKLVEKFMTESVFIKKPGGGSQDLAENQAETLQSQLYIACFWGFKDIVRGILDLAEEKGIGLDVNAQNKGTGWTPLHAATFQEHGPVMMYLLDHGADPERPDSEGRTPKDFASASDKIWGHFAALNLKRTNRSTLVSQGIIKQSNLSDGNSPKHSPRVPGQGIQMAEYSSPDSRYSNNDPSMNAAFGGDVLANDDAPGPNSGSKKPQFMAYK